MLAPLKRYGVPAKLGDLEIRGPDGTKASADAAFRGHGPDGEIRIAIERKTVSEMLGIHPNHRFITGQIPMLLRNYDRTYLVIEGRSYCHRRTGVLMHNGREAGYGRQRFLFSTYEATLMTLREQAALVLVPMPDFASTVGWLQACYAWWQQEWDSHKTLKKVFQNAPEAAILDRIGPVRKIAAQIPDIGWKRSKVCENVFDNVREMICADVRTWAELTTKTKRGTTVRIGSIRAKRIVAWLKDAQPKTWGRGKR